MLTDITDITAPKEKLPEHRKYYYGVKITVF